MRCNPCSVLNPCGVSLRVHSRPFAVPFRFHPILSFPIPLWVSSRQSGICAGCAGRRRNCPVGHRWFDDPELVQIYHRIANVLEHLEAESGIPEESERQEFISYLRDIHSGFGFRLANGERLEAIQFPAEALNDHEFSFKGPVSPDIFVEAFRRQLS